VDADVLAHRPEAVLRQVCAFAGIEFDASMLSWPAGPREEDGMWANVWYSAVHKSTGFSPSLNSMKQIPTQFVSLVEDSHPFYAMLRQHAVAAELSSTKLAAATVDDHGIALPVLPDERNRNTFASVGGALVPRAFATVSAFDSAVQGGDAVWEGLRVYNGRIFNMEAHLQRLVDSAKAMAFDDIPSKESIRTEVFRTLAANDMRDGVHVRVTLSRGLKTTSSMNPAFNVYGSNLIVLPEWKPVGDAATYDNESGVTLVTASQRRNPPQCVDSKIHHCNLINNILPKIQANNAGAADAIMLDVEGFVAETNATNLFAIKNGVVVTPHADYCLPGVTRKAVVELCAQMSLAVEERRISLSEFHSADEVFTTGTMGELTPVTCIDGRSVGNGKPGPITQRIQQAFRKATDSEGTPLPF
jgi:branched-chain amino acid aminotransferase group I